MWASALLVCIVVKTKERSELRTRTSQHDRVEHRGRTRNRGGRLLGRLLLMKRHVRIIVRVTPATVRLLHEIARGNLTSLFRRKS